jgi:hypothetical protein
MKGGLKSIDEIKSAKLSASSMILPESGQIFASKPLNM